MRMSDFIDENLEPILKDWEKFAARLSPAADGLDAEGLRDHAAAILVSISADMRTEQNESERHRKSVSEPEGEGSRIGQAGRSHAAERLSDGFTLQQLIAEYRALRASVIRQWRENLQTVGETELEELTRFNEAVDHLLTESLGWYHVRIEDARDLLNGVLAHDLRGPLDSLLIGTSVLMDKESSLESDTLRSVVLIRNSGERMRALISDLLDFTRTRLGTGLPISRREADMGHIVQRMCAEMRVANPGVELHCDAEGELAGVWDHSRIEQMLGNLIDNAIRHGRANLPVKVSATGTDGHVVIEVHNEQDGIPEEQLKIIFDPLRRAASRSTDEERQTHSVGLGLFIAREIAEAHNGSISVHSSDEDGTTFTVRLPRESERAAATAGLT